MKTNYWVWEKNQNAILIKARSVKEAKDIFVDDYALSETTVYVQDNNGGEEWSFQIN